MTRFPFICRVACALLLAPDAYAQQTLVAFESFDYLAGSNLGGATGGTGWAGVWWSGNNLDDGVIEAPSIDGVGNKLRTNNENGGSFRIPDTVNHPSILDGQGRIGADGASIWVSWWGQRVPGTTDDYGGFSFNEQLVAEKLFVGATYQSGLLGIDEPGVGAVNIPGSDPNALTRFVVRVDHMPGPERIRVWLNPAVPHPSSAADLDTMVGDFVWNEVRFQSGVNNGGTTGFWFDALVVEYEGGSYPQIGSSYCTANPNSAGPGALISAYGVDFAGGQPLELVATALPTNQFGYFLCSRFQGFVPFVGGSQGNLCIGQPFGRFVSQIVNSGANGEFSIQVDTLNMPVTPTVAIQPGETWYFQAWYRDLNPAQTSNLTDGVLILFQ